MQGSILITTQNPEVKQFTAHSIRLRSFSPSEGSSVLFNYLGLDAGSTTEKENNMSTSISEELGGLPMAIAHLAGYIDRKQCSLQTFLLLFHQKLGGSQIWNDDAPATTAHHSRKLAALWDLAIDSLDPKSRELLDTLAFLNPDSIPEELWINAWSNPSLIIDFNNTMGDLRKRCLVDRYPQDPSPYVSIHRALQRDLLYRLDQDENKYRDTTKRAISLVREVYPKRDQLEVPDHHKWQKYERYMPQIRRLQVTGNHGPVSEDYSVELAELFVIQVITYGIEGISTAQRRLYKWPNLYALSLARKDLHSLGVVF